MDEVDLEDVEDLSELEARLYAQIHHEPSNDTGGFSTEFKEDLPVRQVTVTSVVNNKSVDKTRVGRYWNDKKSVYIPPKTRPMPPLGSDQSVQEHNVSSSLSGGVREPPAETVDKSFQPSVKNLSNLRVNPFASGNGPNKKGSSSNDQAKNVTAATKTKNTEQKEKGPFARQIKKLANAVKYDKKRQKADISKKKPKNDSKVQAIEPIEAIELLSSQDSDQDDVIEVPLSPQKILTIESSSEEETSENKTDFIKPKPTAVKDNPSRCTSPCSVISDDFISQSDRMRHMKDCEGPDDEDLLLLQEDVDSLLENPQKNASEASTSGLHPPDYRVTQSSFRAFDVYESESDIQDSVYSKGSKPSLVVRLDHESSSGDDVEELNITQKTKRLRKRATSSNKESDTYIDSTDSEGECQNDELSKSRDGVVRTSISFIAHGEALEKCLTDEQPEGRNNATMSSDKEFLSTLRALAQATPPTTSRANKPDSDDEDELITARAIAENVLQKEKAKKQPAEAVTADKDDRNDAIPTDTYQELTDVFGKIDNLDENAVVVNGDSEDSDSSVQLIAPLPIVPKSQLFRKKLETHTGDPIYHIVYSEGNTYTGGIGWNDEMRKFYNNSWKGERFNVNSVCSQMKTARSLWKIYTDDRFPKYHKNNTNQKCVNCLEFGHFRSKCPKPKRPMICYMCGEKGHHEPRCPNTVCLRCGNKTRMFTRSCNACNYQNRLICPICKVRGHNLNLCPDKWRRYHSTTKPNEYPNSNVEYKNRKFCCICGCRGHLAEHCRNGLRYSEYPIFISEIRSHQKSYDDIAIKSIRSGIGFNLMYKPEEDIAFSLAEDKTKQHYYGRFLIAVGMGYMLKRKRKRDDTQDGGPSEKQPKAVAGFKQYVVNPFASAALGMAPREDPAPTSSDKSTSAVSKSMDDVVVEVPLTSGTEESNICTQVVDEVSNQQSAEKSATSQSSPSKATFKRPDARKESDLEILDSDSNYSFSDHFETPQQTQTQQKPREMAPLPDFIPITDDGDIYPDETVGISNAFVSADTDDEETSKTMSDIPCEAKIYLTNFHSKFLLRPEGNQFLVEKSKAYNIKARLDWTSVGDILILFGLRENQDKFHMELLHRFRELSDNLNRKHLENSQKVPKKTEVLIRFLRENLALLQTDLGNVYELSTRLPQYEQLNTKNGWKAAEKTRRTLNMILIGQTGLRNGAAHLDNLLSHLRKLIDECKDDVVPNDVREDIEQNWKVIFSSYRHKNYDQLVKLYKCAPIKNRLNTLNIDPRLMGKGLLDTTLTKAQKDKMNNCTEETKDQPTTTDKPSASTKIVCNPAAVKFQTRQAKTPTSEKKRLKQSTNLTNQQQQVQAVNSPVANKINAVNAEWENKCVNLLTEIDSSAKLKNGPMNDSKASSVFWSREAMPYIDECLQLGKSNAGLMEKLSRVQVKSSKGLLSYNDYRAIIKIHNAIKGKK